MLTDEQRQTLLAAACVAVLIAVAFFSAYAGTSYSNAISSRLPSVAAIQMAANVSTTPERQPEASPKETAPADWQIAYWTEALCFATILLVAVAGVQAGLFVWQLRIMREDLKDKIERDGPFLHPVIKSNSIHEGFKLFIFYDHPTSPVTPVASEASFTIRNVGRSPALLRSVAAEISHWSEMVATPRVDFLANYAVEPIIEPGAESAQSFTQKLLIPIDKIAFDSVKNGDSHIFLYGELTFFDLVGAQYVQTFCYAYDYGSKNFFRWADYYNKRSRKRDKLA